MIYLILSCHHRRSLSIFDISSRRKTILSVLLHDSNLSCWTFLTHSFTMAWFRMHIGRFWMLRQSSVLSLKSKQMWHIGRFIRLSQDSSLFYIPSDTINIFTWWIWSISVGIMWLCIIISIHIFSFNAVLFTCSLLYFHSTFLNRWTLLKLNLGCRNLLSC